MHPIAERNLRIEENETLSVTISTVQAVKVCGQVLTEDTQVPVAGARVVLNCLRSPLNGSRATSDADGRFELYVAPGKAIRQVTSMGTDRSLYDIYDSPPLSHIDIPAGPQFTLPTLYLTPKQVIREPVQDSRESPTAGKRNASDTGLNRKSATITNDLVRRFTQRAQPWSFVQSRPGIFKYYDWTNLMVPLDRSRR